MSANMDVTMAVHFDVPNVDCELPTLQNINRKICFAGKLKDIVLVMRSQRMLSQDEIRIQGHSTKENLSAVVA